MRACRLVAFFCAVVLVSIIAAPARSATGAITDDLSDAGLGRGTPGAHPLGRSTLDPANVAVAGGRLAPRLPRGTTDGAEVRTPDAHRRGTSGARIRVARRGRALCEPALGDGDDAPVR